MTTQNTKPATRKESMILSMYADLIKAGMAPKEAAMAATERGTMMDLSRLEDLLKITQ